MKDTCGFVVLCWVSHCFMCRISKHAVKIGINDNYSNKIGSPGGPVLLYSNKKPASVYSFGFNKTIPWGVYVKQVRMTRDESVSVYTASVLMRSVWWWPGVILQYFCLWRGMLIYSVL